jgi:hypothetical protein
LSASPQASWSRSDSAVSIFFFDKRCFSIVVTRSPRASRLHAMQVQGFGYRFTFRRRCAVCPWRTVTLGSYAISRVRLAGQWSRGATIETRPRQTGQRRRGRPRRVGNALSLAIRPLECGGFDVRFSIAATSQIECQIQKPHQCGGSAVRIIDAASSSCGPLNQSHTRINKLPVSFRFRSPQKKARQNDTNFGIRTLESNACWCPFDSDVRKRASRNARLMAEPGPQSLTRSKPQTSDSK